jgi:DNA-binding transcriptional LysR family regulator
MYPVNYEDCFILDSLDRGEKIMVIARRLHLTQPAISQRLRKLEDHYGELAVKYGRCKRLTPKGKEIAKVAREILDKYNEIKELVKDQPTQFMDQI